MNASAQEQTVAARVAALPRLPMKELWTLWDSYFPRRPAHHNRNYVEARIAYKIQETAYGAKPTVKQQLIKIGAAHSRMPKRRPAEIHLTPGTVLVREFGDVEHRVTVLSDGGFDYAGNRYKSLSAVARHITGTQWSGPVFFGVTKTRRGGQ